MRSFGFGPRYVVSPDALIARAVTSGFITPDKANQRDVQRAAQYVAEDISERWPEGEGFGSSDYTYALKQFLDEIGVAAHFVGGRLTKQNRRRNPVREVNEGNATRFYVTETKFFLSRDKAEAWLAAHPEGASAPARERTSAPKRKKKSGTPRQSAHATAEEIREAILGGVGVTRQKRGERLIFEGSEAVERARRGASPLEAMLPDDLAPYAPFPAGYGGGSFPTIEHAYTAAMLGPSRWKAIKRMSVRQAVDARAMVTKKDDFGFPVSVPREKLPKGFDPREALREIVRSSFANINRRAALQRVKTARITYVNDREYNTYGGRPFGVLLSMDNIYGQALTQLRDALAGAGPLGRI